MAKPAFDPNESYLTNGVTVYQNGQQYPVSVLPVALHPDQTDLTPPASDYRQSFDFGAAQAELSLSARFPDITVRNPDLYAPQFERRANLVGGAVNDTLKAEINDVIVRGIDSGKSYGEIAGDIQQAMGIDPASADFPGWRAERIARTESMWAINQGMLEQYKGAGIMKVNIDVASTACNLCVDAAQGNPYNADEAEGLLPRHPSCRCVLVGDYSNLLA